VMTPFEGWKVGATPGTGSGADANPAAGPV